MVAWVKRQPIRKDDLIAHKLSVKFRRTLGLLAKTRTVYAERILSRTDGGNCKENLSYYYRWSETQEHLLNTISDRGAQVI